MNKGIDPDVLVPVMKEQLSAGKTVSFLPSGDSMRPLLRSGEDMVFLKKPDGRLHLFDMPFYYRRETDSYVLHRVVGFKKDGSYVMLGDNNSAKEYGITDDDIIGVVSAFYRKGKMYRVTHPVYRLYCNVWFYTRPVRSLFITVKNRRKH